MVSYNISFTNHNTLFRHAILLSSLIRSKHRMDLIITFFTALVLCVVLSFVGMLLVTFIGQDVFNGQIFALTVILAAAVLHYVGCAKSKK